MSVYDYGTHLLVENIFKADDEVAKMKRHEEEINVTEGSLLQKIWSSDVCQKVHNYFEQYRYNQKELVPESSKTQQTTLHKSNTFPKRHLATASLRQRHLSTKSSTPQPRRIRSLNCGRTPSTSKPSQRIYSFDDNNGSVFSDDDDSSASSNPIAMDVSSLTKVIASHQNPPQSDLETYRCALACVERPLSAQMLLQKIDENEKENLMLTKSDDWVNERMKKYLRRVFRNISHKLHHFYQAMQPSPTSASKSFHQDLLHEKILLDTDTHSYYTRESFQDSCSYEEWKENQLQMLQLLLEQDPIQHSDENDTAEAEQTLRDKQKLTIFQNLLLNILQYESVKVFSTSECWTLGFETNEPVSFSSSRRFGLFPPEARRLLEEFTLSHRFTNATKLVTILQCIAQKIEKDVLCIEDAPVLSEINYQIGLLWVKIESGQSYIVKVEVETLTEALNNFIDEISQLLASFNVDWKPQISELRLALEILRVAFAILHHFNKLDRNVNCSECVKTAFKDAVRKSYAKINVEQNSNLSALLLAKVLYSIDAVSKEHSPDHVTVMNEYIGDVIMTSAEVLFECVINDLELNAKDKKLRGGKENNFTNDIILSSRIAKLELCVIATGYKPPHGSFLRWRRVFYGNFSSWMGKIGKQMKKLLRNCIRDDEPAQLERACAISTPTESSTCETVDPDEFVTMRVERNSSFSDSSSDESEFGKAMRSCAVDEECHQLHNLTNRKSAKTDRGNAPIFGSQTAETDTEELSSSGATSSFAGSLNRTSVECSHSIIDFIVLLNRFTKFVNDLQQAIFVLPHMFVYDHAILLEVFQQQHKFANHAYWIVVCLIKQYDDCVLNLDICGMPKLFLNHCLVAGKFEELKTRAENREVDCCRHQLLNQSKCKDTEDEQARFEPGGMYDQMVRRLNNVAILYKSLDIIWDRLSAHLTFDDEAYLPVTSPSGQSDSSCDSKTLSSDSSSLAIIEQHKRATNTAASSLQEQQLTDEELASSSQQKTDVFVSAHSLETSFSNQPHSQPQQRALVLDKQNNTTKEFQLAKNNAGSFSTEQARPNEPPFRRSISEFPMQIFSRRPRPRSATSSKFNEAAWINLQIKAVKTDAKQHVTQLKNLTCGPAGSCLNSLASCFAWRIVYQLTKKLRQSLIECAGVTLAYPLIINKKHLEACQMRRSNFSENLNMRLRYVKKIAEAEALELFCGAFWKILTQELETEVEYLRNSNFDVTFHSLHLLLVIQDVKKQFTQLDLIPHLMSSNILLPVTTNLELYLLSSKCIADLDQHFLQEQNNQQNDLTPSDWEDVRIFQQAFQERKSFTGRQLVERISSKIKRSSKVSTNDRQMASDLCSKLCSRGLIYRIDLELIKSNKPGHLPDLIECAAFTSSYDQQLVKPDPAITFMSSNGTSSQDSDNDSSIASGGAASFFNDDYHYYAFDLSSTKTPLFYAHKEKRENERNFLLKILKSRRHLDEEARNYLKSCNEAGWLLSCSCFT